MFGRDPKPSGLAWGCGTAGCTNRHHTNKDENMSRVETSRAQDVYDAGELIAQLTEQRDLYAQLAGLADHQRSLIADDETERLLAVLAQRQKIVDRLGVLADQLRPDLRNWREIRSRMAEADGRQADRLVGEMNTLLSAIVAKDEADAQLLAARKGSAATALAGLKRSKEAGAAYAAAVSSGQPRVDWADE